MPESREYLFQDRLQDYHAEAAKKIEASLGVAISFIIRQLMQTEKSALSFFLLLAICISPGTAIFPGVLMYKYATAQAVECPVL